MTIMFSSVIDFVEYHVFMCHTGGYLVFICRTAGYLACICRTAGYLACICRTADYLAFKGRTAGNLACIGHVMPLSVTLLRALISSVILLSIIEKAGDC